VKVPPFKSATDITIVETRTHIRDGVKHSSEVSETSLENCLDEFLLRLGQSNAHVLGVLIQVLTRKKVRADFRDYNIRLELGPGESAMKRFDAVAVFDDYIKRHKNSDGDHSPDSTQKIMVQAPRISLPNAGQR
jgi:hypothetical protein